jgi:hypothetical protein
MKRNPYDNLPRRRYGGAGVTRPILLYKRTRPVPSRKPMALETRVSFHEKNAKKLAGPSPKPPQLMSDGQPSIGDPGARWRRSAKAHGHIIAVSRITGETPVEIMARLGLTDEEIGHIGPFVKTITWS